MTGSPSFTSVTYNSSPDLVRRDTLLESALGIAIFVRSVATFADPGTGRPLLLLHGARTAGVASFDLDIEGGSLAADLARRGFTVYLMDARGYGGSTRPDAMELSPEQSAPLTRSGEVVADVHAVVQFIRAVHGVPAIAGMGWATGGQWLAQYAAEFPANISHLVVFNSLWPVPGEWQIGDRLEDADNPGRLRRDALPAYGYASEPDLLGRWESSIPERSPNERRDPAVAAAYARTAIASDPAAIDRSPPSLRVPLGALADSFLLSRGYRLFDPARIRSRVVGIRSELDFWSRKVDLDSMPAILTGARSVECITLSNATHFAHLDRAGFGRTRLLDSVAGLLTGHEIA